MRARIIPLWNESGNVQVQWQTRTEINTAFYSLMRSTNGLTWTRVYTTPNQYPCGAYTGTEPLTYAFTDTNVISPTYYTYQLQFNGDDCNAVSAASTWIARARPPGWIDTFLPVIVKESG